jgi:TPR repeat protein
MNSNGDISFLLHKAGMGDPRAQFSLGMAYLDGDGVRKDQSMAIRWFTEAAEGQDYTSAKEKLGEVYESQGKMQLAEKWYSSAVKDNNADAMYRLGLLIYKGRIKNRKTTEGLEMLRLAAKRGNAGATQYLGSFVDNTEKNRSGKVSDYKMRADKGDVGAQFSLGKTYDEGKDVPQDNVSAAYWYRKAAEQGHPISQYRLGLMYVEGRGVPKDDDEARKLFEAAAALGNSGAKDMLEKMS